MSLDRLITRRHTLTIGLGALIGSGVSPIAKSINLTQHNRLTNDSTGNFAGIEEPSLKERAAAKGLIYGAAGRSTNLTNDPQLLNSLVHECDMLVPEWELKWADTVPPLRPGFHQFDFTHADNMLAFAQAHNMLVRGHALIWHLSIPEWFGETVDAGNAEQLLTTHVRTVAGRYAGQLHSWDVVNEAIELNDEQPNGLRRSPWFEFLGSNYIDLAFRAAADVDPNVMLVYNDYGLEYDAYKDESKRSTTLELLTRLKADGVPIHALGIQSHLIGDAPHFNAEKFRRFLADIVSLGLKIMITELDVLVD